MKSPLMLIKVTRSIARATICVALAGAILCPFATPAHAQAAPAPPDPVRFGPYNASFIAGGTGLRLPVRNPRDPILSADQPWTISCWFKPDEVNSGLELLAGIGDVTGEYPRYLAIGATRVALWMGPGNEISAPITIKRGAWQVLTATFDGTAFHLYSGSAATAGLLTNGAATPVLQLAPPVLLPSQTAHFAGKIAGFQVLRSALSAAEVKQLQAAPPPFELLAYDEGSKPWPVQTRGQAGYQAPQDPATLPVSKAPFSAPVAIKRTAGKEQLTADKPGRWTFSNGWTMQEAPKITASGSQIASTSVSPTGWMPATVPGTVLTTMVDDGIYPDPDYGLNNMAIPETLNKQDYWYRNEFRLPGDVEVALGNNSHIDLTLQGINYQAEVWLNGQRLGAIKGAFRRGTFDVSAVLKSRQKNVLAVRISPPPHPGIPNEQSILGGPGENGGLMELDGPTFLATEGWDWIPAIRDRDAGIWQPVTLTVTRNLKLGDAQVVTTFPKHDYSRADLAITVPVTNLSDRPSEATVDATMGAVTVHKTVTIPPGTSIVTLKPSEFPQLTVQNPRLWWPNGYGKPELYTLQLALRTNSTPSDSKQVRFGIREVTYELSLLDSSGHLQRVDFTPADAVGASAPIVDVSHNGMRQIPSADATALHLSEDRREGASWVSSLAPGAEQSPAIQPNQETGPAPYLVIKVNGVRIAARGGNWGMDDARKRVSREHLEPFFRLNQVANLNIIRNWVGQSTEETFFELADEYGMMVWNDFWESTQNYNIEAEDPALFLDNAADTIRHFRNHPSIVLWCGRNEGVPQPILNSGLEELVRTLDGTRFYSPSSNQVNLQQSGPYSYQDPAAYFTALNRGFSVETGIPSMSTLESFESTTPKQDQWPIDDVWAYHDWHASGNGRTEPFMHELEAEFGASTSLPDFERKAQMLNYVNHRAIFEGMNAHLWQPNSGRMLWMTQPAWPSTMWQILSSDYDTQASFYGTQKACEPVHVQLNLATHQVDVVNTTSQAQGELTVNASVYNLANVLLFQTTLKHAAPADAVAHISTLDLAPLLQKGMVIVELKLADATGRQLSRNLYWLGSSPASYRELNMLAKEPLEMKATSVRSGAETVVTVQLTNRGTQASLNNKLTLLDRSGKRILPAYFSDNYLSLLPGESESVEIRFSNRSDESRYDLALRGWNAIPATQRVPVQETRR